MPKMNCLFCGIEMEAQRSSKKFCSANCRVKYNNLTPEEIEERQKLPSVVEIIPMPPKEAYDSPKIDNVVNDEHSQYIAGIDPYRGPEDDTKGKMTIFKGNEVVFPAPTSKKPSLADLFKDQPEVEGNAHTPLSKQGEDIVKKRRGF